MKKTVISLFLIICLVFLPVFAISASAYTLPAGSQIYSEAAVLMNVDTGVVVYSKNPDEKMYPASTTKLMTALIIAENTSDYNTVVTAYDNVRTDMNGTDAAVVDIRAGEQMTVRDLLYCLLVPSACDAANVLAWWLDGDINTFIERMNTRASELGMNGTNYVNAHGLHDEQQYTTAHDLMLLGNEVIKNELLCEICASTSYTVPATNISKERAVSTTDMMIESTSSWFYQRMKGLKTGYTDQAGRCFVGYAEKDGQRYISVCMGAPSKKVNGFEQHYEFDDTDLLMRWAFTDLSYACVAEKDTPAGEVKVKLCRETDHVLAVPESDYYSVVPKDSVGTVILEPHITQSEINAPVSKGQELGTATVYCAGEAIGEVKLVAFEDCRRDGWLTVKHYIGAVLTSKVFLVLFALIIILIGTVIFINVRYNMKRKRLFNAKINKNR